MTQVAFFFPGQGSQSVQMMQGLTHPLIQQTFEQASEVLSVDMWQMVTEPNEAINQTQHTQPVMLTAGIATWRVYQALGGATPAVMAGHSLGEYTALVAAGALRFEDALPLVRYRAQVMQQAVPEGQGAMAAILGLDDDVVRALCAEAAQGAVVEAVNFNSPGQVVIAGDKAAVERGMALAKEKGAKRALPLPVSVPSHCALMQPAALQLRDYLAQVAVSVPTIPVIHNADVLRHDTTEAIKDALVQQLYRPVRWVETVQHITASGVLHSVECGPGKVLAGLAKRIVPELQCWALVNDEAMQASLALNQ